MERCLEAEHQTVPSLHLAPPEGLSELSLPWFSHPAHLLPKRIREETLKKLIVRCVTSKKSHFCTWDSKVRSLALSLPLSS